MKFVVGSKNPTKLEATRIAVAKVFADAKSAEVVGVAVPSGVDDQPKSGEESIRGAINRARAALAACPDADFGLGLEGGIEQVGGMWFECGWIAAVDRAGKVGIGTSARFQVSEKVVRELFAGKELAQVVDELSGQTDVRSSQGMMGVVTNGVLARGKCYSHGVIMAFAPFVSPSIYWD